ncbi:MAG: CPBP family intramembrane metalloprotease [Marinisporobacter sp.]|jgi:membrane protease YdiL (CAAX protease family)|nr:CPBP family intramembrane metalloprotease [Marinisporobacter sp.]
MEKTIIENKFELSILRAIGILIVYTIILAGIVNIPFYLIEEMDYFQKSQITGGLMNVFGEGASNSIIVLLILRKVRKKSNTDFRLKYIGKWNLKILFAIISLMVGYVLWYQNSIGIIAEKIPLPEGIEEAFENLLINPYSAVISITIIAPIFEEIVMRGIMLEGFLNKYKPHNAIIFSALLFGMWHLNIPQFINATLIGLILGIIYYKTNSLILCIVAHMTNNIMAIFVDFSNASSHMLLFLIGSTLFIISGIMISKFFKELFEGRNISIEGNIY